MAWDLRIENPEEICFVTIRTINSRLWFVNNKRLEEKILTFLARYQELHEVVLYGFILMGNHYHLIARFPKANRARFMKDFNARFSLLLARTTESFEGGRIWARPYRTQCLPNNEDVENWLFYCALNPIHSGLVERLGDYQSYNSFVDASCGRTRKFKYINWAKYHDQKRFNSKLQPDDFATIHELKYSRLPGYEAMSEREYKKAMFAKLEERRIEIVKTRREAERGFAGKENLRRMKQGSKPYTTKSSKRHTHRPLVLTLCAETRRKYLEIYFATVDAFRKCSALYRKGIYDLVFPPGTYKPSISVGTLT